MRENQVRGPIFIVGLGNFVGTDEFGGEFHHQRGFGSVGVPVLGVIEKLGTDAGAYFGDVANADEGVVPATAIISTAQRRGAALPTWPLTKSRRRNPAA